MQLTMQVQRLEGVNSEQQRATNLVAALPLLSGAHIGHVFLYTMLDCLLRFSEFQRRGSKVEQSGSRYVDKLLPQSVGEESEQALLRQAWPVPFVQIIQALNVRPPGSDFPLEKLYASRALAALPLTALGGTPNKAPPSLDLINELLTRYAPDTLRFYLASHHYCSPWSFSEGLLLRSAEQVVTVQWALDVPGGKGRRLDPDPFVHCAVAALTDDFNTPCALTALLCLADEVLDAAERGGQVQKAQVALRTLSRIFGLRLGAPPETRVLTGWQPYLRTRKVVKHRRETNPCAPSP